MINHLRALLMNRPGGVGELDVPYDDYVDPAYIPVALPRYLVDLRAVIFGRRPDQSMTAWRTQQLLAAVRASDLKAYETKFDPRVLWLGEPPAVTSPKYFLPQATGWTTPPIVTGAPTSPDDLGRMKRVFVVAVAGGVATLTEIAGAASGLYDPDAVPLSDTGYTAVILDDPAAVEVTVIRQPTLSFADLLAKVSSLDLAQLFFSANPEFTEDLETFKGRYAATHTIVDRMAAVALAVAWRTEELRRG